jgi:hypothetical protein
MVDGTQVTIDMAKLGTRVARQTVAFKVVGDGVLTLIVDGNTYTYTDTGAVQMFVSNSNAAMRQFKFSFVGAGTAELINCSNNIVLK